MDKVHQNDDLPIRNYMPDRIKRVVDRSVLKLHHALEELRIRRYASRKVFSGFDRFIAGTDPPASPKLLLCGS